MKKLVSIAILFCMLLTLFASCADNSSNQSKDKNNDGTENGTIDDGTENGGSVITELPEGLSGKDVAKILLAGERLGGKLINSDDGIFDKGVETYTLLAERAANNFKLQPLALKPLAGESDIITEFDEVSRNYEDFAEATRIIIEQAERGADTIDFVKKHIRIVDAWVSYPESHEEYYLHVEENSETIFRRSEDRLSVCYRYKDAEGNDVYELYDDYGIEIIRSSYIAGKKYSLMRNMSQGGERFQGLAANNDKGYWEIFDVIYDSEWIEDKFATNFIIMKDDICYKAGYARRDEDYVNFTVTTANKKSDILLVDEYPNTSTFTLRLGSFEGYEGIIPSPEGGNFGTLKLKDGTLIDYTRPVEQVDDVHIISINAVYASESIFGTEGEILISITGGTPESARLALLALLKKWGITCKYDMNTVFAQIDRARSEFLMTRDHLKWNGHYVNTVEDLMAGVQVERERFSEMTDMYDAVKDAQKIDLTDNAAVELNVVFPNLAPSQALGAVLADGKITVAGITLTVDDTLLFVDGEKYRVAFAFKPVGGNSLIHIETESADITFNGERSVTVKAENASFDVPTLEEGEYTLVAYVSTGDGIRSSKYVNVVFDSVSEEKRTDGNKEISARKASDGALSVTYEENIDVYSDIWDPEDLSYGALYDLMADIAFSYGIPSEDKIERIDPETNAATALTGEETLIESGLYRIKYTVENNGTKEGYVYVNYEKAEPPEDELEKPVEPEKQ